MTEQEREDNQYSKLLKLLQRRHRLRERLKMPSMKYPSRLIERTIKQTELDTVSKQILTILTDISLAKKD